MAITAVKLTTSAFNKGDPQLQVVGSTVYYAWSEVDGASKDQIWMATSNLDGSSFTPVQLTTGGYGQTYPQLQVVGSTIYYTWQHSLTYRQIFTATSNLDGSGLAITQQSTSNYHKRYPQLQVVGSTIYYTWEENDGTYYQIWTATSNLNGSSFTPTQQTTSVSDKNRPQLQVVGSTIYYTWYEYTSGPNDYQIWTATSNLDGSSFTPTQQTTGSNWKRFSQLHVVGSTIHYIWSEIDTVGYDYQIWTATSNLDGSSFTPTQQTTSGYDKLYSQLQISSAHYVWEETDGSKWQLWLGYEGLSPSYVTGGLPVSAMVELML